MDSTDGRPRAKNAVRKSVSTRVVSDEQGPLWSVGDASNPTRIVLEVQNDEQWSGYLFVLSYRGSDLIDLSIKRIADARALTAHLLQRVPLGALDRAARDWVSGWLDARDSVDPPDPLILQRRFPDPLDWLDAVAHPGGERPHDVQLARLCKRYVELGTNPAWRHILADEFNYTTSSIQTVVSRARKRRFLTPVAQGKHGGHLTPKALRLLAPATQQSAWDRATPEQRAGALDRNRRHAVVQARLYDAYRAGTLDEGDFRARSLALEAIVNGWEPRDLDLGLTVLADVEQAVELLRTEHEELRQ